MTGRLLADCARIRRDLDDRRDTAVGRDPERSEYLTAPWFAMLIGISLLVAWEKAGGWVVFVLGNVARGCC